jgi:hypothetical protein
MVHVRVSKIITFFPIFMNLGLNNLKTVTVQISEVEKILF